MPQACKHTSVSSTSIQSLVQSTAGIPQTRLVHQGAHGLNGYCMRYSHLQILRMVVPTSPGMSNATDVDHCGIARSKISHHGPNAYAAGNLPIIVVSYPFPKLLRCVITLKHACTHVRISRHTVDMHGEIWSGDSKVLSSGRSLKLDLKPLAYPNSPSKPPPLLPLPSLAPGYCTCASHPSNLSYGLLNHASNSCSNNLAFSLPKNSFTSSSARPSAPFGSCDFSTATRYSIKNSRFAPAGRRSRKVKTRSSRRRKMRARVCRADEEAKVEGVKVLYCEMRLAPTWSEGVWLV